MIQSEDIFFLIRSMSPSEKRYFKVFASRHTIGDKNDYVKLFESIDRQKKYDERSLNVSSLSKTLKSNFPVAKAYLYKMILKSMRVYRLDTGIDNELEGMIEAADYLYQKSLYKQSNRMLQRAKKYAYLYERFGHILRALKLERNMVNQLAFSGDLSEKFEKIETEEKKVLELIVNTSEYENWSHRRFAYITKRGGVRSSDDKKKLIKALGTNKMSDEKKALTYSAKRFFYHGHSMYYRAIDNAQKSYEFQKKRLRLFELYPAMQKADENNYVSGLHNMMLSCITMNKRKEFREYLSKMRNIDSANKWVKGRVFESSYGLELEFYIGVKDLSKALKLVPAIEEGLSFYKGKLNKILEINLYLGLARLYLHKEQFSRSLHWLNLLLNDPQAKESGSAYTHALILNIIVHYELENVEVLPYLLKSIYRYLLHANLLFNTERYILKFVAGVLKTNAKFDLKKGLKELKTNMLSLKDPHEKGSLVYFDVLYWIRKKTA